MAYTILWYQENRSLFLELLGDYSLAEYVQACHKIRDSYLEFQQHPIDVIIDIRAIDIPDTIHLVLEPLENIGRHPNTSRILLLQDLRLKELGIEVTKLDIKIPLHIVANLLAVDEIIMA
jgi:hypothetical protein